MTRLPIIAAILVGMAFTGCQKAEVIPTPAEKADLKVHFEGIINGNDIEWTKNVNGFFHEPVSNIMVDEGTECFSNTVLQFL